MYRKNLHMDCTTEILLKNIKFHELTAPEYMQTHILLGSIHAVIGKNNGTDFVLTALSTNINK